jgi:CBS domain containing-hemolysin-like protein
LSDSYLLWVAFISLLGSFTLTLFKESFRRLHQLNAQNDLKKNTKGFFYLPFHTLFFPKKPLETLYFVSIVGETQAKFIFAISSTALLTSNGHMFIGVLILIILLFIVGDYIPRMIGTVAPEKSLKFLAPLASPFFFTAFPIAFPFLKLPESLKKNTFLTQFLEGPQTEAERDVLQVVRKAQLTHIEPHEKNLIGSVLTFRERIAREVMVPRVDVFGLSEETTIREAAKVMIEEGYSRVPIYQETVDDIVGVLMFKDVTRELLHEKNADQSITLIQKPVLYTPETKKISALLQEFRKKHLHLAIVVDEYGGTEGIITIEDILEEIVGEIADEYDDTEEKLFHPLEDGSFILDARMSILDIEHELNILIPQEGDYDTIGGYAFHTAGSIPSKGFVIHHENFDLEIVKSNERCVEKLRLRRRLPKEID